MASITSFLLNLSIADFMGKHLPIEETTGSESADACVNDPFHELKGAFTHITLVPFLFRINSASDQDMLFNDFFKPKIRQSWMTNRIQFY
ncbi:MAG: hypothetical protein IH946_01835 [Bacteroidetes bacterium]|nr:hypothetical protein [Bacteroidota bacterium]